MISHLNKTLLFLIFLAIFYTFSLTGRGQGIEAIPVIPSIAFGATSLPIRINKPKALPTDGYGNGFILTGPIEFVSFVGGYSTFNLGKGLGLIGIDPTILQKLKELEGKQVTITIKPTTP